MVFDFKFEVNDALASQAIREAADVAIKALDNSSEMGKNFSVQGLLNTLGNIVKPIIAKEFGFQSENGRNFAKEIFPILFKVSQQSKPQTEQQAGEEKPEQPTQTEE